MVSLLRSDLTAPANASHEARAPNSGRGRCQSPAHPGAVHAGRAVLETGTMPGLCATSSLTREDRSSPASERRARPVRLCFKSPFVAKGKYSRKSKAGK